MEKDERLYILHCIKEYLYGRFDIDESFKESYSYWDDRFCIMLLEEVVTEMEEN